MSNINREELAQKSVDELKLSLRRIGVPFEEGCRKKKPLVELLSAAMQEDTDPESPATPKKDTPKKISAAANATEASSGVPPLKKAKIASQASHTPAAAAAAAPLPPQPQKQETSLPLEQQQQQQQQQHTQSSQLSPKDAPAVQAATEERHHEAAQAAVAAAVAAAALVTVVEPTPQGVEVMPVPSDLIKPAEAAIVRSVQDFVDEVFGVGAAVNDAVVATLKKEGFDSEETILTYIVKDENLDRIFPKMTFVQKQRMWFAIEAKRKAAGHPPSETKPSEPKTPVVLTERHHQVLRQIGVDPAQAEIVKGIKRHSMHSLEQVHVAVDIVNKYMRAFNLTWPTYRTMSKSSPIADIVGAPTSVIGVSGMCALRAIDADAYMKAHAEAAAEEENLKQFERRCRDVLKQKYPGGISHLFTANPNLLKYDMITVSDLD